MYPLSANLRLRPLQPSDQPAVWSLMQRIYPPAYAHLWPDGGEWYLNSQYAPENFLQELAQPRAQYCSVDYRGQSVGILRLVDDLPLVDRPDVRASKLHRLYLDQAVQGRGIGKRVMRWAIDSRRAGGYELLWLEAMDSAPAALAFYARMGLTRTGAFTLDMPLMYPSLRGMYRLATPL